MRTAKDKIQGAIEETLAEDETILLADGYEDAFVGIGRFFGGEPFALYNRIRCIEILIEQGLNMDDAEEYFQFNVEGAYVGKNTPVFFTPASD